MNENRVYQEYPKDPRLQKTSSRPKAEAPPLEDEERYQQVPEQPTR